jgi:hypothetical protein
MRWSAASVSLNPIRANSGSVNSPQFTHIAYDDFRVVRDNLAGGNHVTTGRQIPFSIAWLRAVGSELYDYRCQHT